MMVASHHGGMFWPDDRELALQAWWDDEAWPGGPTFGTLVTEVRPALRAALLLGYEVFSINLGSGSGVSAAEQWQTIDLQTLELLPGSDVSVDKAASGQTVWFDTMPLNDLIDDYGDSYAIAFDFGQFGSNEPAESGTVPYEITNAVNDLVTRAVEALAATIPTEAAWTALAEPDRKLPREALGGLLWIFDPAYQQGLGAAATDLKSVVAAMIADREMFLRGQIHADRMEHEGGDLSGPANLLFLLTLQDSIWSTPNGVHTRAWKAVLAELQARGQAHRLWEQDRSTFQGTEAPTWLDVLSALIRLGVILVDGLYRPLDPPYPLAATSPGGSTTSIVLTVWGTTTITLRRETVFVDGRNDGLTGSVAWDYAPGTAQVPPTVIIAAGRGVAIDYLAEETTGKPWQLEIFRVQDDSLVPRPGSRIDPATLLGSAEIVPLANECVFDPADAIPAEPEHAPQLLIKPTQHGIKIVYPILGGVVPTSTWFSDLLGDWLTGADTPCVIELKVGPRCGNAAYAIDAYYHTDDYLNLPANVGFRGGVHLSIWVTGDVTITASNSWNTAAPARGEPSAISGWSFGHQFIAELWEVQTPALTVQPHPLPRPWRKELPVTGWPDMFPATAWDMMREYMWEGLVHQSIQDFLAVGKDDPLMVPAPHVDWNASTKLASWRDPDSGTNYVLRPAKHSYAEFEETASLFRDLLDTGISLIPVVGDAVDIAEAVYVWQTGRDRWGRRLTEYEQAQVMFFSVVPFVSSSFLQMAALAISGLPQLVVETLYSRLFVPASTSLAYSIERVQAALSQAGVLRQTTPASASPQRQQATDELLTQLAEDASDRESSPAAAFATQLIGDTQDGWVGVDDLLSDDGAGFRGASLQIPYSRFLRDNPGVAPIDWIEAIDG